MANLTTDYLDKALRAQEKRIQENGQKSLNALARDLKLFVKEQDEELGRMVNKGFEQTIKQLDVNNRVERLEKFREIVIEALNIKA